MKSLNKVLCGFLGLSLMAAFPAQAEESFDGETSKSRAILFKVHDINPVENTEGIVTHCDFLVTFYNRTAEALKQASLDLGWTDSVSERYALDNDDDAKASTTSAASRGLNRTQGRVENRGALGAISTSIELPALGANKQATVKGSVKTEKCFALLDNVSFNVVSCALAGKEDVVKEANNRISRSATSARNAGSECARLFQFVDSRNPEYYDEFKEISFSEQERLLGEEKATNLSEMNNKYNNVVSNLEKVNSVLTNIQ